MSLKEVDSQKDEKERRPGDHGGRDERGASKLGTSRIAGSHTKLEEKAGTDDPSVPPEGTNLAHTLTWDFGSSELWVKKMSVVSSYAGSGSFFIPILGNNRKGKRINLRIKLIK